MKKGVVFHYRSMYFRLLAVAACLTAAGHTQTGFSTLAIDSTVDPCTNFYQHACGTWLKNNPVPPDQSVWSRFVELHERNQTILREILETSASTPGRDSISRKIGNYYTACMDEKTLDERGVEPLRPLLRRIDRLRSKSALSSLLARLHRVGIWALWKPGSGQDFKKATEVIAQIDQAGLGLPERAYYFKDDERSIALRKRYVEHLRRIFELAGSPDPARKAETVMRIETALARGHLDIASRRDPARLYHRMTVAELARLTPSIDWHPYLRTLGAPVPTLNVTVPAYFETVEQQLRETPLGDWKAYLTWHVIHGQAALLSTAIVNENFDFYGRTLKGAKQIRPRWKRCVMFTDMDLGEALGRKYVERTFGAHGKERMLKLVAALERAMERDIREISWMTPETKRRALEKLRLIAKKIGYPDRWRDYTTLEIRRGDLIGNSLRANRFMMRREFGKIGKPVDKNDWWLTPPTVNAYYDPQNNVMTYPAGILQPPFFENALDDGVNFGGIGAVIGHELTHAFDDEGAKFDAKGNLANWWTRQDAEQFRKRTECFERQYSQYEAVPGLKLNGKLTVGENVADNGGLRIAYMALVDALGGRMREEIDGYTPDQRFFLAWAQIWCTNMTEETRRLYAQTDVHSPAEHRVNGTVSNMPEFGKAFGCTAGQPMVRGRNACRVW